MRTLKAVSTATLFLALRRHFHCAHSNLVYLTDWMASMF